MITAMIVDSETRFFFLSAAFFFISLSLLL